MTQIKLNSKIVAALAKKHGKSTRQIERYIRKDTDTVFADEVRKQYQMVLNTSESVTETLVKNI
ncbi:hypothetical protein [Wenyingzhuangia aestuarii]|uniref:hypothetical protein n=1 Tax=Wenyingzhuangia aestuarii TaxID=1647582 RepID=UPI0014392556|nr:hypothetical protein [Wenyingzhuangia aestuarii]NJB83657.1 hypothetical protein [Wenyingzhuangia aestuarii]